MNITVNNPLDRSQVTEQITYKNTLEMVLGLHGRAYEHTSTRTSGTSQRGYISSLWLC